jgi:hypothetical protein
MSGKEPINPQRVAIAQPDDAVRRTVLRLNALCKTTTLAFALAVGEIVVKNLYGGDVSLLHSRERKKHAALRHVAAEPSLAMSASALYRSIAIFEVCERIGARKWNHISTTHLRLVLSLPPEQQELLLRQTEANRWSARELEERVGAFAKSLPAHDRGGRKRRSPLRVMVEGLREETEHVQGMLADEDCIADSSPDSARAAMYALHDMTNACARMMERLSRPSKTSGTYAIDRHGDDLGKAQRFVRGNEDWSGGRERKS